MLNFDHCQWQTINLTCEPFTVGENCDASSTQCSPGIILVWILGKPLLHLIEASQETRPSGGSITNNYNLV